MRTKSTGMSDINLKGIIPPVTTPFNASGDVDFGALSANIARYNETGLAGYCALGSNGEAVHLTSDERRKVIEAVKQAARAGSTIVAGVNELSTRAAIASAKTAADCGAHAVLVVTPYYYKSSMNQDALASHFIEVADSSPIPVLIYNFPQSTGIVIDSTTVANLASHQNIIGIKDSSGNMAAIVETMRLAPVSFSTMVGNGGILYPALEMGATGAILALACAAPRQCVDLFEAAKSGDNSRARDLQNRLAPLSHIVTAGLGVPGLKAAMDFIGFTGGQPRPPLRTVNDAERQKIKAVISKTGLFADLA